MPKPKKVEDEALIERLGQAFKDVGFEGASLAMLADATGLSKSSLYHRFPNGKEQIAEHVLQHTYQVLCALVFPLLRDESPPAQKMQLFAQAMATLYSNGAESCLLNMLCPARDNPNECGQAIASTFRQLHQDLTQVAREAGATDVVAKRKAEQVLVEIQGALVVARGMSDLEVFARMTQRLPSIILGH
jgi:TetR/AcrR family transcriptional repressor of lmrAB and yxaGH operons